jgi:hypothetical protein
LQTIGACANPAWSSVGGGGDLLAANNLSDVADATTARTNLGLAIGTNVQAYDADLAAIAGLTSAADTLPYFTGSGTASTTTMTAAGRALIDDADATAQRATLGLVIGTNVQAYDADLADIAGVTRTKGDLIVASSSAWTDLAVGTNGHVLTADSAQATGVKWAAASGGSATAGLTPAFTGSSDFYHFFPGTFRTTSRNTSTFGGVGRWTVSAACIMPFSCTMTDWMIEVTASAASSFIRPVICTASSTWVPDTIVYQASFDTSSTGFKSESSLTVSLTAGTRYMLLYKCDVGTPTLRAIGGSATFGPDGYRTAAIDNISWGGHTSTEASGVWSTLPQMVNLTQNLIGAFTTAVFVKVAA